MKIYDIKDLTFSYGHNSNNVFEKVNLNIDEGDVLTILGPNGAGKTTLLNCMVDLLKPSSGDMILCGENINNISRKEIAKIVGYVPQIQTLSFDYTVLDVVLMGRASYIGAFSSPSDKDRKDAVEILNDFKLLDIMDRSYLEISGGQRQQVLIARAIFQKPKVILFDEPTAYLDYGNQYRMLKKIREMSKKGYTVVMTTHNPDHALLLGGKVAIINQCGEVISGMVENIITPDTLTKIYNIETHITYSKEVDRNVCILPKL